MSMPTPWRMQAELLQACNCDYGCPCEFSAPPTRGFCEGMVAYHITKGHFGAVSLDGLGLGMAVSWPKAIHEGNGTVAVFIDERADQAQRNALLEITSGKAGGLPFEIIVTTFSRMLEPQFVPIQFHLAGRNSRVSVGDAIVVSLEPIKNPVTGAPESVRVEHSTGFIFKQAECVSAAEMRVNAGELKYEWQAKAGFVTQVDYSN